MPLAYTLSALAWPEDLSVLGFLPHLLDMLMTLNHCFVNSDEFCFESKREFISSPR